MVGGREKRGQTHGSDPVASRNKKKAPFMGPFVCLAERVGFEPTKGYKPLLVFKTSAFNRSATSPFEIERVRIVLAVSGGFNLKLVLRRKFDPIAKDAKRLR